MKMLKGGTGCALALSIFFTSTVPQGLQASTAVDYNMQIEDSSQLIGSVFNKFRYDMTVEWDQQDPNFKANAQKELENSLLELKKRGVSEDQIQDYMLKNILNESAKKDYELLISTMKKQGLSEEEASEKMMDFMAKNYQQGVGFVGGASGSYRGVAVLIGVIVVGVVTYIIIKKKHEHEDPEPQEEEVTTENGTTDNHIPKWPKPRGPKKGPRGMSYNPV